MLRIGKNEMMRVISYIDYLLLSFAILIFFDSQSSLNGTLLIDNNDDELDGSSSSTVSTAFGFTRSYQNIGGTNNSNSNKHNQTVVKRSLHRLEEQQDEFYQL